MANPFLLPGMIPPTILAICPPNDIALIDATREAGADLAGSTEIIKAIQVHNRRSTQYTSGRGMD